MSLMITTSRTLNDFKDNDKYTYGDVVSNLLSKEIDCDSENIKDMLEDYKNSMVATLAIDPSVVNVGSNAGSN